MAFQKHMKTMAKMLSVVMAFSVAQPATFALAATDTAGHWADATLTAWQEQGLISGYEDGTLRPDAPITRAEFVQLINKALGFTEAGAVSFSDVKEGDWFYNGVAIAMGNKYCSGYPDGTFQPNAQVTRAQAAGFVANAAGLSANAEAASEMKDSANLPSWAVGAIGGVLSAGFMSGYPDGTFAADKVLTRAEAVSTLDRVKNGGADTDEPSSAEDVTISEDGQTLQNVEVEGDVIVSEAVGNGNAFIKNVKIGGDLIIEGGGSKSIHVTDTEVSGEVIVKKEGVRVIFEGATSAAEVILEKAAKLEASQDFTGSIETINIPEALGTGTTSVIKVEADTLNVDGKASVQIAAAIDTINVAKDAADSKIEVLSKIIVNLIVADGKVALNGSGTIKKLMANVSGITKSSSITISSTETATGVDKPSISGGGGGGGGSSSSSSDDSTDDKPKVTKIELAAQPTKLSYTAGDTLDLAGLRVNLIRTNGTKLEVIPLNFAANGLSVTPADGTKLTTADNETVIKVTHAVGTVEAGKLSVKAGGGTTPPVDPGVPDVPEANVIDTASELAAAIQNSDGGTIKVGGAISEKVTAVYTGNKALTIDLCNFALGELDLTAENADEINFANTLPKTRSVTVLSNPELRPGRINTMKIKAPKAKVTTAAKVEALTLDAIKEMIVNAVVATLTVDEKATAAVAPVISGSADIAKIEANAPVKVSTSNVAAINAKANIELTVDVPVINVTTENVTLTVGNGATLATLNTTKSVAVDGAGSVGTVDVDKSAGTTAPIVIEVNDTAKVDTVIKGDSATQVAVAGTSEQPKPELAYVIGITIKTEATDKEFIVGQSLDTAGLVITATLSTKDKDGNNITKDINVTPAMVTGFNSANVADSQPLTITYGGEKATYNVKIVADTLESIVVSSTNHKTKYFVGDTLDVTNLKVTATYASGISKIEDVAAGEVGIFNSEAAVTSQVLTITKSGKTATYTISIEKAKPVSTNVAATAVTKGAALSTSTLSGDFKVGNVTVTGELAWTTPTTVVNATGAFGWTFTPTETTKYETVTGTVLVVANAADAKDPTADVAVAATEVTEGDTLSKSTLSGTFKDGTAVVAGKLEWINTTTVVNETGDFAWKFTPNDTAAYKTITGTVNVAAKAKPVTIVSLGAQAGVVNAGTAGSAAFLLKTTNAKDEAAVTVAFNEGVTATGITVPTGVTIKDNSALLTFSVDDTATAGTYGFKVTVGGQEKTGELVIGAKPAPVVTVSLGGQQAAVITGTGGEAEFALTTTNVANGAKVVAALDTAVTGITAPVDGTIAENAASLTFVVTDAVAAGNYPFTVTVGEGETAKTAKGYVVVSKVAETVTVSSIVVKTPPTKVLYTADDAFDPAGLVISATMSDGKTKDVPYAAETFAFTFDPVLTDNKLTEAHTAVTITYGEKTVDQAIKVITAENMTKLTTAKTKVDETVAAMVANNLKDMADAAAVVTALQTAVGEAVTSGVTVASTDLAIVKATATATGSIKGTIKLSLAGGATLDVAVDLTIELPAVLTATTTEAMFESATATTVTYTVAGAVADDEYAVYTEATGGTALAGATAVLGSDSTTLTLTVPDANKNKAETYYIETVRGELKSATRLKVTTKAFVPTDNKTDVFTVANATVAKATAESKTVEFTLTAPADLTGATFKVYDVQATTTTTESTKATVSVASGKLTLTGVNGAALADGKYYVTIKAADPKTESDRVELTVSAPTETTYEITETYTIPEGGGTITLSGTNVTVASGQNKAKAKDGATVTITIAPESGFELKADSLKVTKTGNAEVTTTTVTAGTVYTFTMPAEAVTIVAELQATQTNPPADKTTTPAFAENAIGTMNSAKKEVKVPMSAATWDGMNTVEAYVVTSGTAASEKVATISGAIADGVLTLTNTADFAKGTEYKIKVTATDKTISDISTNSFVTYEAAPAAPTTTAVTASFVADNTAESLDAVNTLKISNTETAEVEYSKDGGTTWEATPIAATDGTVEVTGLAAEASIKVRFPQKDSTDFTAASEAVEIFKVVAAPTVSLTADTTAGQTKITTDTGTEYGIQAKGTGVITWSAEAIATAFAANVGDVIFVRVKATDTAPASLAASHTVAAGETGVYTITAPTTTTAVNGVTASATVVESASEGQDVEVTVTLAGTAAVGTYTVALTSAANVTGDNAITVKTPDSEKHTFDTAGAITENAKQTVFKFKMPANAVSDLTVTVTGPETTA